MCLLPVRRDHREIPNHGRWLIDAECAGDSLHALVVFRRQWTACTHDLLDEIERLARRLEVGGEHRRERGERSVRVDQQDEELLAHERLEFRERDIFITTTKTTQRLKSTFVNGTPSQADIDQRANDCFAQTAKRNVRLELRDPLL